VRKGGVATARFSPAPAALEEGLGAGGPPGKHPISVVLPRVLTEELKRPAEAGAGDAAEMFLL